MPRFVILRHELPKGHLHWDLMLEGDSALLTWSITAIPAVGHSVVAQRRADHRSIYLDYEGPVSGNRGHVRRWDSGTYQTIRIGDREHVVRIHGTQMKGILSLQQIDETECWDLKWEHAP